MRKLDVIRNRKEQPKPEVHTESIKLEVDQTPQIKAIEAVKASIQDLNRLLEGKQDYDFEKLAQGLSNIADKLDDGADVKTYINELGENLKLLVPKDEVSIRGYEQLLKAVNDIQPQTIDRSKLGTSQRTVHGTGATVIVPATSSPNDVYGIILANTTDQFTKVIINDAPNSPSRFVFSIPARETRGFTVFPLGAHKQSSGGQSWTASGDRNETNVEITTFWIRNV